MSDSGTADTAEAAPPEAAAKKPQTRKPAAKKPPGQAEQGADVMSRLGDINVELAHLAFQTSRLAAAQETANRLKAAEVLFTAQRFNQLGTHSNMRATATELLNSVLFSSENTPVR